MTIASALFFALLAGLLPALLWLWFWLREDRKRPEPRGRIALSFFAGMLCVVAVIPLQGFIQGTFTNFTFILVLWAVAEEVLKFLAGYLTALRTKYTDEPIDPVIYMITVALGFAALENTLFLFPSIGSSLWGEMLVLGNMRFMGATVLHTLSSGIVGAALGLSFYKSRKLRKEAALIGLAMASAVHALFNIHVLASAETGLLGVFSWVWLATIALLFVIEKVKQTRRWRR